MPIAWFSFETKCCFGFFFHYSNGSKEPECTSLRSVPCSQRMTFLPVLVNVGPLEARQIDLYQTEPEGSSVQKETRKSLAQAVWFLTQWPPSMSQMGLNNLLNLSAICLLISLSLLSDLSLLFRLSVVASASLTTAISAHRNDFSPILFCSCLIYSQHSFLKLVCLLVTPAHRVITFHPFLLKALSGPRPPSSISTHCPGKHFFPWLAGLWHTESIPS